jgi:dTDP-4-amino-4,6-dideoxygalactose transaminase
MSMRKFKGSVPFLDLKVQYSAIRGEIQAAMQRVIESQMFILGPEVTALEVEIAEYCKCTYGIGVSSGTDALLVSLMALGVQPGDEVITTPYSFFATAGSIARLVATPVFVDMDPATFNIDAGKIDAAVTLRTKVIMPVHLFGQMAEMDEVMAVANKHGLRVVEDAAQAIGAEYKGSRAGSTGDLGCFSFFPSKNLGAFGGGGMVTTNDSDLADRVRLLRNHGGRPKYVHGVVGGNFRLDAIQAAVVRAKLPHLDDWTNARQRNAALYRRLFEEAGLTTGSGPIQLPTELPERRHIYNQFVVRCTQRDELTKHLTANQIGSEVYYPLSLHQQECFQGLGLHEGDYPSSEQAAKDSLALPIYPELTPAMIEGVVSCVRNFYKNPVA